MNLFRYSNIRLVSTMFFLTLTISCLLTEFVWAQSNPVSVTYPKAEFWGHFDFRKTKFQNSFPDMYVFHYMDANQTDYIILESADPSGKRISLVVQQQINLTPLSMDVRVEGVLEHPIEGPLEFRLLDGASATEFEVSRVKPTTLQTGVNTPFWAAVLAKRTLSSGNPPSPSNPKPTPSTAGFVRGRGVFGSSPNSTAAPSAPSAQTSQPPQTAQANGSIVTPQNPSPTSEEPKPVSEPTVKEVPIHYPEPTSLTRPGSELVSLSTFTDQTRFPWVKQIAVFRVPNSQEIFLEIVTPQNKIIPLPNIGLRVKAYRSRSQIADVSTLDMRGQYELFGGPFHFVIVETVGAEGKVERNAHFWNSPKGTETEAIVTTQGPGGTSPLRSMLIKGNTVTVHDSHVPVKVFEFQGVGANIGVSRSVAKTGETEIRFEVQDEVHRSLSVDRIRVTPTETLGSIFELEGYDKALGGDYKLMIYDRPSVDAGVSRRIVKLITGAGKNRQENVLPIISDVPLRNFDRDVFHSQPIVYDGLGTRIPVRVGPWTPVINRGPILWSTEFPRTLEGSAEKIWKWFDTNCDIHPPKDMFEQFKIGFVDRTIREAPRPIRSELEDLWYRQGRDPFQNKVRAQLWYQHGDPGNPAATVHLELDLSQSYSPDARKYLEGLSGQFTQLIDHEGIPISSHRNCLDQPLSALGAASAALP